MKRSVFENILSAKARPQERVQTLVCFFVHKTRTLSDEFVVAVETLVVAGVVGLEDEFHLAMHRHERLGRRVAAETVLRVLHAVRVDREDVHVVEQASKSVENSVHLQW